MENVKDLDILTTDECLQIKGGATTVIVDDIIGF